MSELAVGFQSLPEQFQEVIRRAQEQLGVSVTPLQALSGGFSGAMIYLVSVASDNHQQVEHLILKLDRKNEKARADEIRLHADAASRSPGDFPQQHMAQMRFERVEQNGAIAIFYTIAGQSLHQYRPLSAFDRQGQLETLFRETYRRLLEDWNVDHIIRQSVHPRQMLDQWLGFRIKPGAPADTFIAQECGIPPDSPGLLVKDTILPNPLAYARDLALWGSARPLDVAIGLQHGDLNTNNILVKFDRAGQSLEGFYLIDFALFKEEMPLFYDLRYLEASYLVLRPLPGALHKLTDLVIRFGGVDQVETNQVPVDVAGACAVINTARQAFEHWINVQHPSLRDDLWGQYMLAGVAAGLNFTHKAALPYEERMLGLLFAAANLKRFTSLFSLSEPAEGRQIFRPEPRVERISSSGSPTGGMRRAGASKTSHNLPAQYSSFIGRESELAAARSLLLAPEVRLVTFTGPGGVGKTRLAMQAASGLLDAFPDGVYLAPLAEISEPDLVVSRIAQALGLRDRTLSPLETLKDFLQDRNLLLLLDNLEQVVEAAPVILDLLAAAPGIKVLATSRVVLQVRGEHEFPVPPMQTPGADGLAGDQPLDGIESVRLFVERARAASPNFSLTSANAPAVTEICRRLDGLPLAIELAAARIKLFPPQALLDRLVNRLDVLTGGARDLPARQQTLRSTLDWSHSLLAPAEQALFARLGVFVGGFSLEGAEAVCNTDQSLDVLTGIEALMNNSLLRQAGGIEGQPRFGMLETMREYALDQLRKRGELEDTLRSHASYYLEKVNREIHLFAPGANQGHQWLEGEHDNLRAVLTWGLEHPESAEPIGWMMSQMVWFWYRRGLFEEGEMWTDHWVALTAGQGPTIVRAMALLNSASMSGWRGNFKKSITRVEESLQIWLRLEDDFGLPVGLFMTGIVYLNMGDDGKALPLIQEAQRILEEQGNDWLNAVSQVHLCNAFLGLGQAAEARQWIESAYAISQVLNEEWLTSFVLNNFGELARTQGDYQHARQFYQQSEALLRAMGDKGDLARLINSLGYVALHERNLEEARAKFHESLALFRQLGHKRGIAEVLIGLAGLRLEQDRPQQATQLLGAAEATMRSIGAVWWPADRSEVERSHAALQGRLGTAAFDIEWERGKAMPFHQVLALALDEQH